jgi:signal peptidase I
MTTENNNIKNNSDLRTWVVLGLLGTIFGSIFLIRFFLYDIYSCPSASMAPTINVGNMVIVNKYIYKNAASGTRESTKPKRGEIVAFHPPHIPSTTFLGRAIGIPGDVVNFSGKQLTINGKPIKIRKVDEITFAEKFSGISYQVQYQNEENPYREFSATVPANHYFMMGDNRDNSLDSRGWGFLPSDGLVGKVVTIW